MAEKGEVFIPWEERFAVGIPIIDHQHRQLLELANRLFDTCRQGKDFAPEGFRSAASAAVDYVKVHFSTEEQIMDRVSFPEAADHKAKHREFVGRVLLEVRSFEEGKPFAPNRFVLFLKEWILSHIALVDKRLASYVLDLAKKGLLK